MSKEKALKLIPLLALIVATVILIITVLVTPTALMQAHWIGLGALVAVILIQLFNTTIGYQATGVLLLIGTFSFLAYTPSILTVGMGKLNLDVFCLGVLVVYVVVHRKELPDWLMDLWYGKHPSKKE